MNAFRQTVLSVAVITVMAVLLTGFTGSDAVYCQDSYLDTPAVALLPQSRMKSAVKHLRAQADMDAHRTSDRELYLLAKIIECEARYEPYQGKVAVGAVVLNRVMSGRFPDTLEQVIFQKGQFQPMTDGGWQNKEPSEISYRAAQQAFEGKKPLGENGQSVGNALFFMYEELAGEGSTKWFKERLSYITTIGNHDFYGF